MDDLQPRTTHLVGACGSGMRALAELLLDLNWSLSGSDFSPPNPATNNLIHRGFRFYQGHDQSHVEPTTQLLIHSPAVPTENVERSAARQRQIPEISYGQMIGRFLNSGRGVCIAGTHGKSTTTAMTACVLQAANRLSGVVLGAEVCDRQRSGWKSDGDLFVAESCEFQQTFHQFHPQYATILNIEPDHFDCYPDLQSLMAAFTQFARQTDPQGTVILNQDCPQSRRLLEASDIPGRRVTFGCGPAADWSARSAEFLSRGVRFQLFHGESPVGEVPLQLHGRHNLMNALAAAATCGEIGVPIPVICDALAAFRGIRRRLEFRGTVRQIAMYDDYAHHPTAVQVTLATLREIVGNRTIHCIFQPHQVLRTQVLMEEFSRSFGAADQVLIAPVFAAREDIASQSVSTSEELARRIATQGIAAKSGGTLDQIVSTLEYSTRPGDVIVTMGAGDIDRIHHEFT